MKYKEIVNNIVITVKLLAIIVLLIIAFRWVKVFKNIVKPEKILDPGSPDTKISTEDGEIEVTAEITEGNITSNKKLKKKTYNKSVNDALNTISSFKDKYGI